MSLTIAVVAGSQDVWGGRYRVATFDITLDNSYPSNGYALTAASFAQGTKLVGMMFIGGVKAAAGIVPIFDTANSKLACFFPTGGATGAATLTAPVTAAPGAGTYAATATPAAGGTAVTSTGAQPAIPVVFSGALAAPALTGGIGIEIPNATDLSSLTLRALVVTNS